MEQVDLDSIIGLAQWYIPEILLGITAVVVILVSLFKSTKGAIFFVAIAGVVLNTLLLPAYLVGAPALPIVMSVATIVTLAISGRHQRMEYYLLILSVLIGAQILAKVNDFIMILLSMEMISLSSYVLTAGTDPDLALPKQLREGEVRKRAEAGWKFFLFGSVATAIMVFGMSYLFGVTGSINLPSEGVAGNTMAMIGSLLLIAGLLFKMTAAPFHLWAPDVYQVTPAPIVAFLSVVPKLAAFCVVMKIHTMSEILAVVAIVSIVIGTLAAINQNNAKRMMAFSSVAQAGFLLTIVASSSLQIALYYTIVFAAMNFVVFIVIDAQEKSGTGTDFSDFSAIGRTNTFATVAITLGLVSLTGLPPMAGFMAKLFVFTAIWHKFSEAGNYIFLAVFIIGLLATVASLFFYLKIPFYSFFRHHAERPPLKISLFTNLLLVILVGLLLALFLAPGLVDGLTY